MKPLLYDPKSNSLYLNRILYLLLILTLATLAACPPYQLYKHYWICKAERICKIENGGK